MISALLLSLLPFIDTGVGIAGFVHEVHPHWGQVAPQSPEWYELCSNRFKSFNPDTGLWRDMHGKFHYCRFK